MATNSTVSELRKAAEVSDREIDAAVQTYFTSPKGSPFRFPSGYEINVADAFRALEPAKATLLEADCTSEFMRNMVRTAILLAHPVKG